MSNYLQILRERIWEKTTNEHSWWSRYHIQQRGVFAFPEIRYASNIFYLLINNTNITAYQCTETQVMHSHVIYACLSASTQAEFIYCGPARANYFSLNVFQFLKQPLE